MTEGLLLFGMESLLLCEGYTLSPTGDVCCRRHHPSRYSNAVNVAHLSAVTAKNIMFITAHLYSTFIIFSGLFFPSIRDAFISNMLNKELPSATCRRWLYEDIKEARFMRFLLEVRHPNSLSYLIFKSCDLAVMP